MPLGDGGMPADRAVAGALPHDGDGGLLGGDGEANTITRTLTYVYTDIIPRYAIA